MLSVNIWAILGATLATFLFGWLWYSPVMFGRLWARKADIDMEKCKNRKHPHVAYIIALICMFIAAYAFALAIGTEASVGYAVVIGLIVGICWVGTSFGINYAFADRGLTLFLIDSGYYIGQFVIYGLVLGYWH